MLTRRNAILGLSFATAACAGAGGGTGLPPGIKTGNIAPDDNLVLGPDENILVGMVARVHRVEFVPGEQHGPSFLAKFLIGMAGGRRPTPPFRDSELVDPDDSGGLDVKGRPSFFVIEADGRDQFGVPFRDRSPELVTMRRPGETIRLSPFAMRVPRGPHRVVAFSDNGWVVYEYRPPLEARVPPGKIAYIGRFGPITQIVSYSKPAFEAQIKDLFINRSRGETNAWEPISSMSRSFWRTECGTFNQEGRSPRCRFRELFFHSDADQDLPLLRQRFPRLANARIVNVPMAPSSNEVWKRWPDVLRPLSVS
ncbi:MAG: hypothetical protein ING16_06310 [Roseomonas sp.]|nr:hypothetical protein [Roseomonas sp.]MCA3299455.1 hypothetical protein [Roseomonas sp.]